MIRDQRHMQGPRQHATVADVRLYWQTFARDFGFIDPETRLRVRGAKLTADDRVLDAYVSDSRWVARCAACGGGVATWRENTDGCCLDCGRIFQVKFPADALLAEAVLNARPEPDTRNWNPADESVDDLKVENVTRALPLAAGS